MKKQKRQSVVRMTAFGGSLALAPWGSGAMAQDTGQASGVAKVVDKNFFEMFFLPGDPVGTAIVWFLFVLSMVCIGYAFYLAMKYRRTQMLPFATISDIQMLLEKKQYRQAIEIADRDESYLGKLISGALNEAGNGFSAMERAVEESSDVETTRLLRPLEYLNVVGNIAPMMGLFGTVYGMILAFSQLVAAGGKPDPAQLADGISTALVTTFWGLIVAIPALTAYSLIRNRIDASCAEGAILVEDMIRPFKPSGKKLLKDKDAQTPAPAAPRPPAQPRPNI